MARPCECDRPGCRLCWLYATRADYRELWDRATARTRKAAPARPPCAHRGGDPIPAARPVALGLSPLRDWRECGHPAQPLGPIVCRCRGCGPKCPGYAPAVAAEG